MADVCRNSSFVLFVNKITLKFPIATVSFPNWRDYATGME